MATKTKQPFFTVRRGHVAYTVEAKLANMRKAQEWVIYPIKSGDDTVMIQCSNRIAKFSLIDGKGMLSAAIPNGAYGVHLMESLGATEYQFPMELVNAILDSPVSGQFVCLGSRQATYLDPDFS
jgi:hypothetical protein